LSEQEARNKAPKEAQDAARNAPHTLLAGWEKSTVDDTMGRTRGDRASFFFLHQYWF